MAVRLNLRTECSFFWLSESQLFMSPEISSARARQQQTATGLWIAFALLMAAIAALAAWQTAHSDAAILSLFIEEPHTGEAGRNCLSVRNLGRRWRTIPDIFDSGFPGIPCLLGLSLFGLDLVSVRIPFGADRAGKHRPARASPSGASPAGPSVLSRRSALLPLLCRRCCS